MSLPPPLSDAELHAFVDGELDAGRYEEVARILRDDAALARRVAAYTADRDRLRAAVAGRPLPAAWARRIEVATATGPRWTARLARPTLSRRSAIAAGLAIMVGGSTVLALRWSHTDTILAAAQAAREGAESEADSLPAALLEDAGRRDAALRSRLGMKLRVPDLRPFGFHLARVTTYPRAAQMRYGDAQGRRLTIYVRPSDGQVRFDLLRQGATRICVWQDDVVGAVIMAPMSAGEMLRVATAAYGDLNL